MRCDRRDDLLDAVAEMAPGLGAAMNQIDFALRGEFITLDALLKATGLAVEPRVTQVVDPPSFEIMAEMIDTVAKEMAQ